MTPVRSTRVNTYKLVDTPAPRVHLKRGVIYPMDLYDAAPHVDPRGGVTDDLCAYDHLSGPPELTHRNSSTPPRLKCT